MERFQIDGQRVYEAPPGRLPSVTTVLSTTNPKKFDSKKWVDSLCRKGLSPYEANLYRLHLISSGLDGEWVDKFTKSLTKPGMSRKDAEGYTIWKSDASARRGSKLHDHIENNIPIQKNIEWGNERLRCDDSATDLLLESLWKGGVFQQIEKVVSVEQRLWWYEDGIGYAGAEDICYYTVDGFLVGADWKSKDPKPYDQTAYGHEYKLQLTAYALAKLQRYGLKVNRLHVNYAFSDGSKAVQIVVEEKELEELIQEWNFRLRLWWKTQTILAT